MIAKRITSVLGMCLIAAILVAAQVSKLDGTWEGKMEHEGRSATVTFEFHVNGTLLTGKVFRGGHEFGDIKEAKVETNKIAFKVNDVSFEGSFDGDQLKLNATDYTGETFAIDASRKKPAS